MRFLQWRRPKLSQGYLPFPLKSFFGTSARLANEVVPFQNYNLAGQINVGSGAEVPIGDLAEMFA